jgi:hypothetical protein
MAMIQEEFFFSRIISVGRRWEIIIKINLTHDAAF